MWLAGHNDGSDNRINTDTILEASTYGTVFGILAALGQWIRKTFKNRGKTRRDLQAEREAARINRTSGALEEKPLEYFQAAQEGAVDGEALDELIETVEEMQGYYEAGKLLVPGEQDLAEMRKSITDYTAALAAEKGAPPAGKAETTAGNEFSLIREQLLRQKELTA